MSYDDLDEKNKINEIKNELNFIENFELKPISDLIDIKNSKSNRFIVNPKIQDFNCFEEKENKRIQELVSNQMKFLEKEIQEKALSTGYQEGWDRGYQDGQLKATQENHVYISEIKTIIQNFENIKFEIYQANERFLIEIIFQVAKKVLLKDLNEDKNYLERLIKEMLRRIDVKDNILIKLNKDDFNKIENIKLEVERNMGHLSNLNFEISSQLDPGSCQIETRLGMLESVINDQLEKIHDVLMKNSNLGTFIDVDHK